MSKPRNESLAVRRLPQYGTVYGYDGDTDGTTAYCGGRLGDEPHRKPFGKPCPRCERTDDSAA